jgi:glycosyltransferase involved in cell wall biosynthesis
LKILIAGGVFRLTSEQIRASQPAPEVTLLHGLHARGIEADSCPLENRAKIAAAKGYDVVHVHHLSRAAVAAALSPRARPFVFTEHAFQPPVSGLHRSGLRVVAASASAFVCLSNAERDFKAHRFPRLEPRLTVIPNGIDFSHVAQTTRRWEGSDDFRMLFVGQLIAIKQVHRAIQALREFPHVRLRIVYHNSTLEGRLMRLANDLRVSDRVDFVGQIGGVELVEEYLSAHLLVLPSVSEALPSVVTEALMTGLPVAASDVGGISEQVANAGVLFPAQDCTISPTIAAALADYSGLAERASQRSLAVRREYSIDQMVTSHISLYQRLLRR